MTRTPLWASRAVRVAPTGPSPTTSTSQSNPSAISRLRRAGIVQGPQAFDLHPHAIAGLEKAHRLHRCADAAGRAGEDQVARLEGHRLAQVFDLGPDVEDQPSRIGILPHL